MNPTIQQVYIWVTSSYLFTPAVYKINKNKMSISVRCDRYGDDNTKYTNTGALQSERNFDVKIYLIIGCNN